MSKIGDAVEQHYDELERKLITRQGIYASADDPALATPDGYMKIPPDHMAPEMLMSIFQDPRRYRHSGTLLPGDIAIWLPGMEWVFFLRPGQWAADPGGLYPEEVMFTLPLTQLTLGNVHVFTGLVKLGTQFGLSMETIKPLQDVICRFK